MKPFIVLFLGLVPLAAQTPSLLRFAGLQPVSGTTVVTVPVDAGRVMAFAAESTNGRDVVLASRLIEANGTLGARREVRQNFIPQVAIRDRDGSFLLGGSTGPADRANTGRPQTPAAITRVDSTGATSTAYIALPENQTTLWGSTVTALTTDASGTVYATGQTGSPEFPTTADAFQREGLRNDSFGPSLFAFYVKLSPDLKIQYSTLLGGAGVNCVGGSHCVGVYGTTWGNAIAALPDKTVTIAGATASTDFPFTKGTVNPVCTCSERTGVGFIARFAADGRLTWATAVGQPAQSIGNVPTGGSTVVGLTVDPDGTTYAVVQDYPVSAPSTPAKAWAARLGSDARTIFSSETWAGIVTRAAFGAADAWVAGTADSTPFASGSTKIGDAFIAHISVKQPRIVSGTWLPYDVGSPSLALNDAGQPVLGQASGAVITLAGDPPVTGPVAIVNVSEPHIAARIAPLEVISLFGYGFPSNPQVTFDELPGNVVYSSANQINVVVPKQLTGRTSTKVQVGSASFVAPVVPAAPGIANGKLNQDYSVNSPDNPASRNSVVMLWAHGAGGLPVQVEASTPVQVLYAGPAPGFAEGVLQINIRLIDAPVPYTGVRLRAGDAVSEPVLVWTK